MELICFSSLRVLCASVVKNPATEAGIAIDRLAGRLQGQSLKNRDFTTSNFSVYALACNSWVGYRAQAGLLFRRFGRLPETSQRDTPTKNAATNSRTSPRRQRLPSGNGPPPETRGGTQNNATTARISAGMNRNAIRIHCEPLCENRLVRRSGVASVLPRNQNRMALPSPATAPRMRKIGDVIAFASSVTAPLSEAKRDLAARVLNFR